MKLTWTVFTGAAGIIFPHIDTPEDAAIAVSKCRYAYSGGDRSLSPSALIAGVTDIAPPGKSHLHVADENIAVIVQIESQVSQCSRTSTSSLRPDVAVTGYLPNISSTVLSSLAHVLKSTDDILAGPGQSRLHSSHSRLECSHARSW